MITTQLSSEKQSSNTFAYQRTYLERDTEATFIDQAQKKGCNHAKQRLIEGQMNYIKKLAKQYRGYQINEHDLIQEGIIGLLQAIDKFDINSAHRLHSFSRHYILSALNEYVIRNVDIVKIATTKAQRKLFFNLRKMKNGRTLTPKIANEIADALTVSVDEVWHMEKRLSSHDVSFNTLDSNDEDTFNPKSYLHNPDDDVERMIINNELQDINRDKLKQALTHLDERSYDIIHSRWLVDKKTTLETLAVKYKISKERVRQLESIAFKLLRKRISLLH